MANLVTKETVALPIPLFVHGVTALLVIAFNDTIFRLYSQTYQAIVD